MSWHISASVGAVSSWTGPILDEMCVENGSKFVALTAHIYCKQLLRTSMRWHLHRTMLAGLQRNNSGTQNSSIPKDISKLELCGSKIQGHTFMA